MLAVVPIERRRLADLINRRLRLSDVFARIGGR